jgi:hypothetical protein
MFRSGIAGCSFDRRSVVRRRTTVDAMDHARHRPAGPTQTAPEQVQAPDRFAAIRDLQRTAGNAALAQLLSSAGPQRLAEDTLEAAGE